METTRTLELISEFGQMGVFDMTLAGGEPLLHPDVLKIISQSIDSGIRVGVLTNGTMLNEKFRAALEERTTEKNFILQISIDSINPAINDFSRGQTVRVERNIRALRGTSMQIQLACVIHKLNVDTAYLLIEQFYPDVKRFHFLNVQRTEQALKHPELLLTEDEVYEFWMRLNEYAKQFPPDLFLPSLRVQMRARGRAHVEPEFALSEEATFACSSCSAGWTHININTNFDVLGCDIAKDYTMMGNVRYQSFTDVWNSPQAHAVRNAPFPACYKIRGPKGEALMDSLKPEFSHQE